MNNQLEGVGNKKDHIGNGENPPLDGAGKEQFVPRMLLDYAAPLATDARGPIRLPRLTEEPPSYGASTISVLQNNCYHGLEHEDSHDHIQTFLQYLGAVRQRSLRRLYQVSSFPIYLER
jgi:hypothetical protein